MSLNSQNVKNFLDIVQGKRMAVAMLPPLPSINHFNISAILSKQSLLPLLLKYAGW